MTPPRAVRKRKAVLGIAGLKIIHVEPLSQRGPFFCSFNIRLLPWQRLGEGYNAAQWWRWSRKSTTLQKRCITWRRISYKAKKRRISTRRLNCNMSSLRLKFCSSTFTVLILVPEYGLQVPDNNKRRRWDECMYCYSRVSLLCLSF